MSALENDNKRKEINNKPINPLTLTSDWHITSPHNFCRAFSTWAIRLGRLGNHPLHYWHKINCTVLYCIALHCIALHCIALYCNIHIYSANRKWDTQILITNLRGNVQQLEERINNQISGVPRLSKTDS